jgi:hypothetical protein
MGLQIGTKQNLTQALARWYATDYIAKSYAKGWALRK